MSGGTLTMSPIHPNDILQWRLSRKRLELQQAHVGMDGNVAQVEIHRGRFMSDQVVLREEAAVAGNDEAKTRQQITQDIRRLAETCGVPFDAAKVRIEQRVIQPVPAPDFSKSVDQQNFLAWQRQRRDHPTAGQPSWIGEYHVNVRDGGQLLRDLYQHHAGEMRYLEVVERDGGSLNVYKDNHEDPGSGFDAFWRHAQTAATQQSIEKRQDADAAARQQRALDEVRRMAEDAGHPPGTIESQPEYVTIDGVRVPKAKG